MDQTIKDVFGVTCPHNLELLLTKQRSTMEGVVKCRVVYDHRSVFTEFASYERKHISTLKLVHDNEVSYAHKSEDRQAILSLWEKRGECDDVLIVKNGWITDSSYSNIVFQYLDRWVTPDTCLLEGTMRQFLLDEGIILTERIKEADIGRYKSFKLINALLGWDFPPSDVSNIN
jgi:4-amino-4-deoxychorismate lyase